MKQVVVMKSVLKLALVSALGLQVACSSSSSDPAPIALSGSVVAAPVAGASVQLKDVAGNDLADPEITGSDGSYSTSISGAVPDTIIVESTGGTYTDEATGASTDAGSLMAYVDSSSMSAAGQAHATPASTIVYEMVMSHGMTLSAAQAAFESAFGFAADTATAPVDATNPTAGATEEELLAGLRAAAFSQLTADLGLTPAEQFDLLNALAEDLADGTLDGMGTGGAVSVTASVMLPIDIQNRFVTALTNFHNDGLMGDTHGNDMTGLDNSQIGMLSFSKVATTGITAGAYKVEYIPGMMDAMQGKTMFQLKITDDSDQAVTGTTVTLMLMMFMEDRKHSTPDLDCAESATPGTYDCTVYYVMPSVMATGDSMGFWQMQVMVDMKSAVFYPKVMMAMGDTTRVLLKGITDTISMMGDVVSRPYNIFRESLMGDTGNHTFKVFIAPMETMMSFPALETGLVLNGGDLTVNTVTVQFSTDTTTWSDAGYDGTAGFWSLSGITGLTAGTEGKIYVKLFVNTEQKTTNGLPLDGMNEYQTFNVTP